MCVCVGERGACSGSVQPILFSYKQFLLMLSLKLLFSHLQTFKTNASEILNDIRY